MLPYISGFSMKAIMLSSWSLPCHCKWLSIKMTTRLLASLGTLSLKIFVLNLVELISLLIRRCSSRLPELKTWAIFTLVFCASVRHYVNCKLIGQLALSIGTKNAMWSVGSRLTTSNNSWLFEWTSEFSATSGQKQTARRREFRPLGTEPSWSF